MLRNKSLRRSGGSSSDAVVKGLADGSLTSFKASDYGVTSLKNRRFENFTSLTSLDLTGVTNIPAYTAYGCTAITNLVLNPNISNVDNDAFNGCYNCRPELTFNNATIGSSAFVNVQTKKLQGTLLNVGAYAFNNGLTVKYPLEVCNIKITGSVGNYGFQGNSYINSFTLDPTSNITSLGSAAFGSFGNMRSNPSSNPFTFDLRNSTFTTLNTSSFSGSTTYKNSYFNIYFPNTLNTLNSTSLQNIDHCNMFYKNIPTLSNVNAFAGSTNYKNFFPYNLVQTAKTATNWTSSTNGINASIYGYSDVNEFSLGDTLPVADDNGYALTWYSDEAMTTQVTIVSDPTQMYYCQIGAKAYSKLFISGMHSTVTVTDGINTYSNGDFIAIGTTITITATGDTGYDYVYNFTLNDVTISSGDTYTVTSSDITIVCVYWDGVNPPADRIFGNNSWTMIKSISDDIATNNMTAQEVYATYGWSLGDTKAVTLSTNEVIELQIIGFNHDTLSSDHTSKAGITLQMKNCLATKYKMHTSSTNYGGWNACAMRTTTLPTIKALLPSDLQAVISLVDKKAANGGSSYFSQIITSQDDLFLLAEIEVFGTISTAEHGLEEGNQYAYWALHNTSADRIKYFDNSGNPTTSSWWERSCTSSNWNEYMLVNRVGDASKYSAGYEVGVSFALCI